MKKVLGVLITVLMVFTMMPAVASAATYDHVVGDGESFDISTASDGDTIGVSGAVTLTGTKKVNVFCSAGTTLTIDNLNIDVSATSTACPITFDGAGNTLILKNTSYLKAGYGEPAVKVLSGTSLNITGGESDIVSLLGGDDAAGLGGGEYNGAVGSITISGGNVQATGGENGAGIGAGINMSNGTVKITGGDVEAYGGSHAAGIGGGGDYGGGGTIEISGGIVEAYGSIGGAGIGGGYNGNGGSIKISGTADITAYGGYDLQGIEPAGAAGIGGGFLGSGGTIDIQGGTVKGYGSKEGAGIGGGSSKGASVTISGGTVEAEGGNGGAGIGSGEEAADTGSIKISGGSVTALGGIDGAGIGGGYYSGGGTIEISGSADVAASGGQEGAGIGSGNDASVEGLDGGTIKVSGGSVVSKGGANGGAGIGGGKNTDSGTITIEGTADVKAYGTGGAGIGGGCYGDGGSITITGGTVDALGDTVFDDYYYSTCGAAGIGGGVGGNGGTITISGGSVKAESTLYGAGIGSGDGFPQEEDVEPQPSGGIITISGGTIEAIGGEHCSAGIGGGYNGRSGVITISGGTVDAIAGESAAGIGGGVMGDANIITISGGIINATSEGYGAGIGGGEEGHGGIINISGGTVYALSKVPEIKIDLEAEALQSIKNPDEHNLELFIAQSDISIYVAAAGIGDGATGVEPVVNDYVTNRDANSEVTISGGLVYAGGPEGDIGPGALILISGGSAVFLKNDLVNEDPPIIPDGHVHKTSSDSKDPLVFKDYSVYGIKVAADWTDATGGYFRLYTLDYDANGGSGGFETTVAGGQEITLDDGTSLTNDGYVFTGWNSRQDNEGTSYNGGEKMLMPLEDKTLYAVWAEDTGGQRGMIGTVLTDDNGDPLPGYTIELHSVVLTGVTDSDGKVTFSNVLFKDHTLIIKNSSDVIVATFTLKMSEGSASGYVINGSEIDVTYTGHTVSVQIDISFDGEETTVEDVTIMENPDTGSGSNWLVWAAIASVLTMIAAMFALRRRVNIKY